MGEEVSVQNPVEEPLTTNAETPLPFDVDVALTRCGFPVKFLQRDWQLPQKLKGYAPPDHRDENGGFRDFKGLFLTGATGTKKTASLCLLARDWLRAVGARGRVSWRFVSFPELCLRLQEAWGRDAEQTPSEVIADLSTVPFLILDEIGAEKTTEFVLQSAYTILNKREWAELPIFGTSNLTIDEIGSKMDPRIASRIKGLCHIVAAGGPDMRAHA
jgi:DNA replication protein DnaC